MVRKKLFDTLLNRLTDRRRFIQIMFGPRQVGKTTLVHCSRNFQCRILQSMQLPHAVGGQLHHGCQLCHREG